MSFRRLIAYDPETGTELGELPDYTSLRTVRHLDGLPTMDLRYPAAGTNRTWLNNALEVAVQRVSGDGTGEEHWNSRYLLATTPDNDELADGVDRAYSFVGIRAKLDMALVLTPSNSPKPDGSPYQPLRIWTDKNVGQILGDIFTENQAAGYLEGLTKDFGFVNDSTGTPWTPAEQIPYLEVPVELPYGQLVQMFVNWGVIDVVFNGREFRCFPARTHMYRDLTVGDAPVGFYWGGQNGITKSTQATSYLGITTDALVIGSDGKSFTPHNNLSDGHAYYGPTMRSTNVPWARNADQARVGAEELFRGGRNKRDEFTIEADWDASSVEPDRDFRLGDRVFVQIGDNPTAPDGDDNVGEQRVLVIEETDGKSRTGSVTFADRMLRVEDLARARLLRITAGAEVASTGQSRSPGPDEREPTAPTDLVVTTTNEADETGRQRAVHSATVEWDGNAVPDPVTGQIDPIEGKAFEWQLKHDYTNNRWQTYTYTLITDLDILINRLPADTDYLLRVRVITYTGITPSAWLTSGTLTVPADLDALQGADEIWDGRHRNIAVRGKRTSDAGAGFAFVTDTSESVAEFTTTTPTLDYGVGSKLKSFRRQCKPGDIVVVDGEHKYTGTSGSTRIAVRWFDAAGATISTTNAISSAAATSGWTSLTAATATAPAGAASFTVRVNAQALGASSALRVRNVSADRRTMESRIHDDQVIARTIIATDPLTTKHTATGPFLRAASGSGFQASPTGFYFVSGGVNVVSFDSGGIYIKGTIETGSGMIIGGSGLEDIVFSGGQSIGEAGGFLELIAAGSGVKITGNMVVSGGIAGTTLQMSGATTLDGSVQVGGSGQTVGFFGTGPISKPATATVTLSNQATLITAVNSLANVLGNLGLIVDNIS